MKRIAIDLLFLAPGVAGGRVYAEGLLRGLAAVDCEHEYFLYTRCGIDLPSLPADRFRQVIAPVPAQSTLRRTFWEYARLPRRLRRDGIDLFHGAGNMAPAVRSCPFVLTVHDVIYRHFPQSVSLPDRWFRRLVHPAVARRADRVIVPSRTSAEEAVRYLSVPEERIRIVHYGPGNGFQSVTDASRREAALARHGVRAPYVLSVCRTYPHKNLAGLLHAFAHLRKMGHSEVQLLLIGERYRTGHALDQLCRQLGLEQNVIFPGFVTNEDLNALYTAADAFAFPSLSEGFGLPVLEAMACGTPVVASTASAVPEAVGSAGVLADARDPAAFAAGLARVLRDSALRADLRAKGRARVQGFTWEKCARETLNVYHELLYGPRATRHVACPSSIRV